MADDLNSKRTVSIHVEKFRVAIAALIGLAIGALAVAAAVIIAHDNNSNTPAVPAGRGFVFSAWKPAGSGDTAAQEIADYVAPFYRLTASEQLALITPVSTTQLDENSGTFTGNGLTVAVKTSSTSSTSASLEPLEGQTVAYDICGQGNAKCAVAGTPSTARELLLRREALELALYTFEYMPKVSNVAVVLPPGRATKSKTSKSVTVAVLFVRSGVRSLLREPIDDTLEAYPPEVSKLAAWQKTEEAELVDTITARNLFSEKVESEQDSSNLLVLNPLPAQ